MMEGQNMLLNIRISVKHDKNDLKCLLKHVTFEIPTDYQDIYQYYSTTGCIKLHVRYIKKINYSEN